MLTCLFVYRWASTWGNKWSRRSRAEPATTRRWRRCWLTTTSWSRRSFSTRTRTRTASSPTTSSVGRSTMSSEVFVPRRRVSEHRVADGVVSRATTCSHPRGIVSSSLVRSARNTSEHGTLGSRVISIDWSIVCPVDCVKTWTSAFSTRLLRGAHESFKLEEEKRKREARTDLFFAREFLSWKEDSGQSSIEGTKESVWELRIHRNSIEGLDREIDRKSIKSAKAVQFVLLRFLFLSKEETRRLRVCTSLLE